MYIDEYKKKLTTPERAVAAIPEGATLMHGACMAEPPALLEALAGRIDAGDLHKLRVFSLHPFNCLSRTLLAPQRCDCVEANTWFVSAHDRSLVRVGLNYFIPNHFHQVPRMIRDHLDLDVCVITVSPMDAAGYFSLGTNNDVTSTGARHAKTLIVEANRFMPRVFGQSQLHVSEVDAIVEYDTPLQTFSISANSPQDDAIGRLIVEMVPDGATLQLGVGAVPNAMGEFLKDHKDLGVHTEVFGSVMVKLIKEGVITGARKTLHPLKHVFTLAQGDQEMLDFINENPAMESYPVDYTNHPSVIAQNDNLISINAILEVDLLGQVNSESLGGFQYSGTGGQLDFVRGAYDAKGGKSILGFHATAQKGTVSRVVPRLSEGTIITTHRNDVHYLVTEFGVANLKGRSTRDRALAIIGIAAPQFRDDLLREAENMYLL